MCPPSDIDFIAPGILALCVMSTSLVALSIATGFERSSGVLRRLHVTPLGQPRLVGAKIAGVLVTEMIQVVAISLVALLLTWRPDGGSLGAVEVVAALLLGSIGFAGIGLALAGSLRAEVNLAASNGLYLVLLLLSGIVVPLTSLPTVIRQIVIALPQQGFRVASLTLDDLTALTDPTQLREWAPFDASGSLDTVGAAVKLTWVGTGQTSETRVI